MKKGFLALVSWAVISSLAGRTQHPILPPGDVRIGGFGGAAGLARFLTERGIERSHAGRRHIARAISPGGR